jgi:general secretion pathway protein J
MRPSRGFTLIEVVIATSLLALGLVLGFATIRGAGRATERAETVSQRDERLRAVQGFLRGQLSAALPIAFEFNPDSGEAMYLRASRTKLEFVATMPGYLSRGGPYLQTLELVRGENGQRLVFQHQQLTTDGAIKPEREPVVLLDGIADASFETRGLDTQSRPGRWQPSWDSSAQLPPLLRLRLKFTDKDRHWPDFVVAPRLGAAFGDAAPAQLAAGQ